MNDSNVKRPYINHKKCGSARGILSNWDCVGFSFIRSRIYCGPPASADELLKPGKMKQGHTELVGLGSDELMECHNQGFERYSNCVLFFLAVVTGHKDISCVTSPWPCLTTGHCARGGGLCNDGGQTTAGSRRIEVAWLNDVDSWDYHRLPFVWIWLFCVYNMSLWNPTLCATANVDDWQNFWRPWKLEVFEV